MIEIFRIPIDYSYCGVNGTTILLEKNEFNDIVIRNDYNEIMGMYNSGVQVINFISALQQGKYA